MTDEQVGSMDNGSIGIPQVDSKNKKDEILAAYQNLMKKYQDAAQGSHIRKAEVQRQKETEMVDKASGLSTANVDASAKELANSIQQWTFQLSRTMADHIERLAILREAIGIEKKRLEEVHAISAEADSLAQLIDAHSEKQKELQEEQERVLETWKREREQYEYQLKVDRRKEETEYEEKRAAKVKELEEREMKISEQENELADLRQLKGTSDQQLSDAVVNAKKKTERRVRQEEEVKAIILAEQTRAGRQVLEHTVDSLRRDMKERDETVARLKQELAEANRGVKDVALKVIEGRAREQEEQRSVRRQEQEPARRVVDAERQRLSSGSSS